jgi:Ras-related GTP-binding protein C/D
VDRFLALICLMRKESIERQGLVDYNVQIFQNALQKVFEIGSNTSNTNSGSGAVGGR